MKILLQTLYEQGQTWYEQTVVYGNEWVQEFQLEEINSRVMINWARDMEDIIEDTMSKIQIFNLKYSNRDVSPTLSGFESSNNSTEMNIPTALKLTMNLTKFLSKIFRNHPMGNGGYGADRLPLGNL